jgi:hypothetical protein
MSKLKPEVKARWLAALRGGDYAQTTGRLAEADSKGDAARYCCWGVLCDLAIKAGVDVTRRRTYDRDEQVHVDLFNECDAYPPPSVLAWAFDEAPKHDPGAQGADPNVPEDELVNYYAELNDDGSSFLEIADEVERKL